MFKFATNRLTRKQPEENEARRRLQKDLFSFSKIADKGFPTKPSALDYDRKLKLLAIGTKSGDIRMYGSPGVQISCYQDVPFPIQKLLFIQGTGQLISLVERINRDAGVKVDITYHLILWQLSSTWTNVEKIKEYQIDQKFGRISALALLNDNSYLFIGFESGDTYVFNVGKFEIVPGVINKDFIIKKLPDSQKKSPGAVESICHHPKNATKLLLAFNRGLFVIFDFSKNVIDLIKSTNQPLESACFFQTGDFVSTCHTDGSFLLWDLENKDAKPITQNVYGPYPCRPISKIMIKSVKNNDPLYIFAGGVPRASYSDKISISVMQGDKNHVAFDFTSKIIDFLTIDRPQVDSTTGLIHDNPSALLVLLEEEFVCIDLLSENWPQHRLPYLYSVHSSAIICTHYCNNVSMKFYNRLKMLGNLYQEDLSEREWPVKSNQATTHEQQDFRDLMLTGHEDGSVHFWDVTHMSMTLLYKLKSADYFQTDAAPHEEQDEENWPPFRKVGTFDPYSDDPKLGIQKMILCPQREILVIAGTAGQVLVMSLNDETRLDVQLKINRINIVTDMDNFIWKGHDALQIRETVSKLSPGYQPMTILQLYPPATVSALCLNTDWKLISMGTSHGFALFDYAQMKDLLVRCTLDPILLAENAASNAAGAISRRKSLKKSLRESFRKLRRGRSQKTIKKEPTTTRQEVATHGSMRVEHVNDEMDHRPIERQVESREFKQMDDIPPSVIRYIYFVRTYITNTTTLTNSLWVGTNTGVIYIYALQIPDRSNRLTSQIQCVLAKEMRLKHRAPVVHIQVIDKNNSPLPDSLVLAHEQSHTREQHHSSTISPEDPHVSNHKVIICSEEQFKVFQLPTLKPYCKFKLTAVEGARVRRIAYNKYISKSDPSYSEYCLSCLTNLGDLSVYSLPALKRQVQTQCMKQQDINAITSFVFSKFGQAFYLQSPSEFVHISMSACDNLTKVLDEQTSNVRSKSKSKSPSAESKKNTLETSPPPPSKPVPAPRSTPRQENTQASHAQPMLETKLDELTLACDAKSTPNARQQQGVIEMNDSTSSFQIMNATDLSLSSNALNVHHTSSNTNANASSSGVSSAFTGSDLSNVDISMDSVVDKFNEDFNNISSKIQPINEENPQTPNACTNTNKSSSSLSEDITESSPDLQSSASSSTVNNDAPLTHDYDTRPLTQIHTIPIAAKRHTLTNNESNHKIEQVTKRIETNNKLEYRETAID